MSDTMTIADIRRKVWQLRQEHRARMDACRAAGHAVIDHRGEGRPYSACNTCGFLWLVDA